MALWIGAAAGLAAPATAQNVAGPDAWKEDLQVLARELPRHHVNPFTRITQAQWDSSVARLEGRLGSLNRNQIIVEIFRLVASLGDAHTTVQPNPALGLHHYPLELYLFDDGLYVRRAADPYGNLIGARVLRIGRASAEEAITTAGTIISHENEWWVKAWAPFWLMIPEMLDGLGLADDPEHLPLVVERQGQRDTVIVAPAGPIGGGGHGPVPIDMSGWASMRQADRPLWEQEPDQAFWWRYLPDSGTLYASMRAVVPGPRSGSNQGQWEQVFTLVDSLHPRRLVIDIRENTGGNGFFNRFPIQQILRRPAIDRPGSLYVIIGRRTFSAGQQFANLLEFWTQATFVGEPTGQRPSQYGDHEPLVLPHSGIAVNVSTVFHQAPNEFDRRSYVPPSIYTPLTAAAYRRGEDPAMSAILAADTMPTAASLIEAALRDGDTARAEGALRAAQTAVRNRFVNLETQVNALGYRLLAAGETETAIAAFRLNTRAYSGSANTFDSLGEALLTAGRRDEAIAAYRHALQIDPTFRSSIEALRRLGIH